VAAAVDIAAVAAADPSSQLCDGTHSSMGTAVEREASDGQTDSLVQVRDDRRMYVCMPWFGWRDGPALFALPFGALRRFLLFCPAFCSLLCVCMCVCVCVWM